MESIRKLMAENTTMNIDEKLNQYTDVVMNPKKLERANEIIMKYGIPQELLNDDSISISGLIKEVNADDNTFVISSDEKKNSKYLVSTIAEKLNDLVKKYWGSRLTISIKLIESNDALKKYELIEVQ